MSEKPISIGLRYGLTNLSEIDILNLTPPTGANWQEVFNCVLIPEKVLELRILDVGAGTSDAVSKLLELGADAYALDPQYRNRAQLRSVLSRSIKKTFSENRELLRLRKEALSSFNQSIKGNPERYIEGFATDIPFQDNYFDIVYSRVAILSYLDVDTNLLNKAIDECLRVIKPGGSLRLFPFKGNNPANPKEIEIMRSINNQRLLQRLRRIDIVDNVEIVSIPTSFDDGKTLVIQKTEK